MGVHKKIAARRAVFLDRDGVVIRHVPYLADIKKVRLLPGVARSVARINRLGYLAVVITNQPMVAHGLLDEQGVDKIHALIFERLKKGGARIDAVYYCPHHPHGTVKKYAVRCRCRKPELGMILKAVKQHRINLPGSYLVGDETMDIVVARKAGIPVILVKTGKKGKDGKFPDARPDFMAANLEAAVKIIERGR